MRGWLPFAAPIFAFKNMNQFMERFGNLKRFIQIIDEFTSQTPLAIIRTHPEVDPQKSFLGSQLIGFGTHPLKARGEALYERADYSPVFCSADISSDSDSIWGVYRLFSVPRCRVRYWCQCPWWFSSNKRDRTKYFIIHKMNGAVQALVSTRAVDIHWVCSE